MVYKLVLLHPVKILFIYVALLLDTIVFELFNVDSFWIEYFSTSGFYVFFFGWIMLVSFYLEDNLEKIKHHRFISVKYAYIIVVVVFVVIIPTFSVLGFVNNMGFVNKIWLDTLVVLTYIIAFSLIFETARLFALVLKPTSTGFEITSTKIKRVELTLKWFLRLILLPVCIFQISRRLKEIGEMDIQEIVQTQD